MAKEILEAVRAAEAECSGIIQQAKDAARLTTEQAQRQAEETAAQAKAAAEAKAAVMLSEADAECAQITAFAQDEAARECEALQATAESMRGEIIREAVEKFF